MQKNNREMVWLVLGYAVEGPWLLRDVDAAQIRTAYVDDLDALSATPQPFFAEVNAIMVVALPTAPQLAELVQWLRGQGHLVVVVTTTVTAVGDLAATTVESCRAAQGVICIQRADVVRYRPHASWRDVPAVLARAIMAMQSVGHREKTQMVGVDRTDIEYLLAQRPMLGMMYIENLPPLQQNDGDQQEAEREIVAYVHAMMQQPLVYDVLHSKHFIITMTGGEVISMAQVAACVAGVELHVDDTANIVWGIDIDPHATVVRAVLLASHAWPEPSIE